VVWTSTPLSEPPARPAPPPGITVLRRDAIALALSGDGRFLAGGDLAGQALLWDLERGRFLWADSTPEGNRLGRVVFAGDAPVYLAGSFYRPDRPWRLWSADPMERRGELGDIGWTGLDAALNDAGTRAVTLSAAPRGIGGDAGEGGQKLELWELSPARVVLAVALEDALEGSVALDARGERFALSDDRGGVRVYDASGQPGIAGAEVAPLFEVRAEATSEGDARIGRLVLSADGELLVGARGARLVLWSLKEALPATTVVLGTGGVAAPVRGLHRVRAESGSRIVAITRPSAGGLVAWDSDGLPAGWLESGCRCESHALSADGSVAACGCAEASELRWGRLRRPEQGR
jgi:hypothetical protein